MSIANSPEIHFQKGITPAMKESQTPEPFESPLKSVAMTGRLCGLMLSLNLRQEYVNRSQENSEFVYTFPLPHGAALLDLRVFMDGKELSGMVIGRQRAEKDYEEAIDKGDTPIMVSQSTEGLFTANIGNIKPGEEVAVEVRYAQLLRFEQGHICLRLPTVIAPRFGDPYAQGGLGPHETDRVDLTAEYPLTLNLSVVGELAKARLSSPTHQISCQATGETLTVTLAPGAKLDRDVVINFDDLTGRSFALNGPDEGLAVVLASFCPDLVAPQTPPAPLRLKILVDCSGSMAGDSIYGAKQALRDILKDLGPEDAVSYSRFGNDVQHDMSRLTACSPEVLSALGRLIDITEADLGGTEMRKALISTFRDIGGLGGNQEEGGDLLLITDGDIWDTYQVIQTSRQSGQRVFAIGVSSAPAESLLRQLAEETGGGCELISPRDDFEAAVRRQLSRMRSHKAADVEIDWGAEPVWKTALPKYLYDGETTHIFAAFDGPLKNPPRLKWQVNGQARSAVAGEITADNSPDLRRLGGHQRLEEAGEEEALDLALKYQLVSYHTNLYLVRVREEGDKAKGLPELRQVSQMLAAGYGGLGSVVEAPFLVEELCLDLDSRLGMEYFDELKQKGDALKMEKRDASTGRCERRCPPPAPPCLYLTPQEFLSEFAALALASTDFLAVLGKLRRPGGQPGMDWRRALDDLVKTDGLDWLVAWALMLSWLADKLANDLPLSRQAERLLRHALAALDDSRQKSLSENIDSQFPGLKAESWG